MNPSSVSTLSFRAGQMFIWVLFYSLKNEVSATLNLSQLILGGEEKKSGVRFTKLKEEDILFYSTAQFLDH